jgi:hypothetical protein
MRAGCVACVARCAFAPSRLGTHLGASGTGHQGLAHVADIEGRGRLDVVPVLAGEGILGLLLTCGFVRACVCMCVTVPWGESSSQAIPSISSSTPTALCHYTAAPELPH